MKKSYKLGIDYGTTNSSIALTIFKNTDTITEVIEVEDILPTKCIPSRILISNDGELIIGRGETNGGYGDRLLRAVKMTLDPDSCSYNETFVFDIDGRKIQVVDCVAAILKRLREKAELVIKPLGIKTQGVVMGVPVSFGDLQKDILKQALVKAGFYSNMTEANKRTEFVSEPLAVAVDYAEKITEDRNVMIFDFGGGTLDVAIMNLKYNIAINEKLHPHEVLAKKRATIGGELLNKIFFVNCFCNENNYGIEYLQKIFRVGSNVSASALWDMLESGKCGQPGKDFVNAVEELKCRLSFAQNVEFKVKNGQIHIANKVFARSEFETAIKTPLPGEAKSAFDRICDVVTTVVDESGLDVDSQLDVVLPAGGSSIIPCVLNYLDAKFPYLLHEDAKTKEKMLEKMTCIASGLSIIGCKEDIIEDILDTSYGFWDAGTNSFAAVLSEGTLVKDATFNKAQERGYSKSFGKKEPNARIVNMDIYQQTQGIAKKLGTIKIQNADSNSYTIYMSVDKKQTTLNIYLRDNDKKVWLDDQGKVSAKECKYILK